MPFASDRSYMLIGQRDGDNKPPATIALAPVNFGAYPMSNGLTRLQRRFLANPADVEAARSRERQAARRRDRGNGSASSLSRSTTSTGTTKCASFSKSARASRPTA